MYTQLVDKYEVKQIVSDQIGEQYVIPTLGVWDTFDEIDFSKLPDKFVLKCTHDSGSQAICTDKRKFDKERCKRHFEKCLRHNYFWGQREWPYKNVKPRIIAEKYMVDSTTHDLRDYKFFAFNGKVRAMFIATERQNAREETKFDFFDENFVHLPFLNGHPNAKTMPPKPQNFEEMKQLAEKLSRGLPQVRIDFYEADGCSYFGEFTFFHWSGMTPFEPAEWDSIFGKWIDLSLVRK